MEAGSPSVGDVPSGATMRPRYMGRIMNTYPVSEPEMEHVSSLSAQATIRFSMATFLLGLALSIWINATFYTDLTLEAKMATKYIAPFLLAFSVVFAIGGGWAQFRRRDAWTKIKAESNPIQAIVPADQLVVAAAASAPGPLGN
jgi:hypothetical protein